MKQIFIVTAFGGEWDESWEVQVIASFSKDKCEEYIAKALDTTLEGYPTEILGYLIGGVGVI